MAEAVLEIESSFYEKMDPEKVPEIPRYVDEAAEVFAELLGNGTPEFKQALQQETVNSVIGIHKSALEREEKAKLIRATLRVSLPLFIGENNKRNEAGIFGEVSTHLALEQLQFGVQDPSEEDDLWGIDMWVDSKDGTPPWAVQVKTNAKLEEPVVHRLMTTPGGNLANSDLPYSYHTSAQNMLDRITNLNIDAPALLIEIPGGDNTEYGTYNSITGAPSDRYVNDLYDKIESVMFTEEY